MMAAAIEFLDARPHLARGSVHPDAEGTCVIYTYRHDAAPHAALPTQADVEAWLPEWHAALDSDARQIHRTGDLEGLTYTTLGGHMGGHPVTVRVQPADSRKATP